jgi:outer membrane protein TolC
MKVLSVFALVLLALPLAADDQRGPIRLSLRRAIEIALSPEGSARIELALEQVKVAAARNKQARAALLPDFEGVAGFQDATRSLVTQGVAAVKLPFNYALPERVGPYSVSDNRMSLQQNVLDLSAWKRYQAASTLLKASKTDVESQNDITAAEVARAYLTALRGDADLEAAEANVKMSEAVYEQARRQKDAGTGTQIDVTRSNVVLANDRQHLLATRNFRTKARLQLLRAMRMRLDTEFELTDSLSYDKMDPLSLQQAKELALKTRPDLRSQEQKLHAAQLNYSAAKFELFPTFGASADYGLIGWTDTAALPTRTITMGMRIPIFDSGRRAAHREETGAQLRQERIKEDELKQQVELDVRTALDSLQSAEDQVSVAREGLQLADNELTQAQRRYEAGVAVGVEVTDAQTRLAHARDNQTLALYNYNLARIDLGQALGDTRKYMPVKD